MNRLVRAINVLQSKRGLKILSVNGYRNYSSSTAVEDKLQTDKATTLIIGGGIAGVSLAYNLSKSGQKNVVLVEKTELTAGSTWHAAGLITYYNPGINMKQIHMDSLNLYYQLENETGMAVGEHRCGSLRLAQTPGRVDEFKRQMTRQGWNEAEQFLIGPDKIKEICPILTMDTILAGLYTPNDGHIDPYSLTQSLASGARKYGAKLLQNTMVEKLKHRWDGRWEIRTNKGTLTADRIVNASGFWGKELGELAGVHHPLVPVHHQYLVTKSIPELETLKKEIPVLRDLENSYYLRQERGGLLVGPYENSQLMKTCDDWYDNGPPKDFGKELFQSDFDRIESIVLAATKVVPALESAEIKTIVSGPITYTPDLLPLAGPVQGMDNYWCILGMSYGISHSGGIGKYISDWILNGEPPYSLIECDPNRYGEWADGKYTLEKARESYGFNNELLVPHEERFGGRPTYRGKLGMCPIFERNGTNVEYGFKSGWEVPLWFPKSGDDPGYVPSFRRTNWFESVGKEVENVMNNVGVIDLTSFAKFVVSGDDSKKFLDFLTANTLPEEGNIVLSHLLTPTGKVLSEFTITNLGDSKYLCITGSGSEFHDLRWMESKSKEHHYDVRIDNVTETYGCLGIAGPLSRKLLKKICDYDVNVSNKRWKFMQFKNVEINGCSVNAMRISYTGEMGWELFMKMEDIGKVYECIMENGKELGLGEFGAYAMDSLRMEKGFRAWGSEMNIDKNPIEAGLGNFIKNKPNNYIGKESIQKIRSSPLESKLCYLKIKTTDVDAEGNESVWHDGAVVVGNTTSATYGYNAESCVGFAYLPSKLIDTTSTVHVEILGELCEAEIQKSSVLKPENLR